MVMINYGIILARLLCVCRQVLAFWAVHHLPVEPLSIAITATIDDSDCALAFARAVYCPVEVDKQYTGASALPCPCACILHQHARSLHTYFINTLYTAVLPYEIILWNELSMLAHCCCA